MHPNQCAGVYSLSVDLIADAPLKLLKIQKTIIHVKSIPNFASDSPFVASYRVNLLSTWCPKPCSIGVSGKYSPASFAASVV